MPRDYPLLEAITSGSVAVGGWLMAPCAVTAEVAADIGFDYCCIDMQHGLIDFADTISMLQAMTGSTTTPAVRVPANEPSIIGRALDAGAMAVIVPMANTAEQARQAVQSAMYPPVGQRSSGPRRAALVEGPDYLAQANQRVQVIPMIETVEATTNLDEILAVEHVNAVYVGPLDLSVSMGITDAANDQTFSDMLDHIVERCTAHGVVPGIHASPGNIKEMIERGFRIVTAQTDITAIQEGLSQALAAASGDDTPAKPTSGF